MTASYTYSKIDDDILGKTLEAIGIQGLSVDRTADGSVMITFPKALSTFQQSNLDEFMTCRGYIKSTRTSNLWISSQLMLTETTLSQPATWQLLGGCVMVTSAFFNDPSISAANVSGILQANSSGALLHLTEDDGHGNVIDLTPTPFPVPNTNGVKTPFQFTSQLPLRSGSMIYRLEAKSALVIGASVGFASLTVLESLAVDGAITGLQPPGPPPDIKPPPPPPPPQGGAKGPPPKGP